MKTLRRPFTLIEVLIGLSLLAVIIGSLFFSLRLQSIASTKLATAQAQITQEIQLQQMLNKLFLDTISLHTSKNQNELTLHFTVKEQIDRNTPFGGAVENTLSIKKIADTFCFCLTQLTSKKDEQRCAILMRNVKTASYEFLFEGETDWEATTEWEEEKKELPRFLHLTLTSSDQKAIKFVFWISAQKNPILYSS